MYGTEDLYLLLEVIAVDNANRRTYAEHVARLQRER